MYALEPFSFISYFAGTALSAVWAVLAFYISSRYRNSPQRRMFHLLFGSFACIFISRIFTILAWVVADYPFVFSPGDLSWVGSFFFLIAVMLDILETKTLKNQSAYREFGIRALVMPAVYVVLLAVNISFSPESIFHFLLYGIPMTILAYYALLLFLEGGRGDSMRLFYISVLLWLSIQLTNDLVSALNRSSDEAVPDAVFTLALICATASMWFTARKGVGI